MRTTLEPPVQILPQRTVVADLEIGDVVIAKGAPVWLRLASGNRDPRRFGEPDLFDPSRRDNQHLGFGFGVHACVGAPLARLEAQLALTELTRRLRKRAWWPIRRPTGPARYCVARATYRSPSTASTGSPLSELDSIRVRARHRLAAGRQRDHQIVHPGQPALPLLDNGRLETPPAVPRHRIWTSPASVNTVLARVPLRELPPLPRRRSLTGPLLDLQISH